jgi:hypothetical protein
MQSSQGHLPGAIETLKGAWLCLEETRKLGQEEPPNLAPPEHQESQTPQSPNLLESPEASQKEQENAKKESPEDENTPEKESFAEERRNRRNQVLRNQGRGERKSGPRPRIKSMLQAANKRIQQERWQQQ